MPSTRSKSVISDKVIHEYPVERKPRSVSSGRLSVERQSKSTDTTEFLELDIPETDKESANSTLVAETGRKERKITVQADIHTPVSSKNYSSHSVEESLGEVTRSLIELLQPECENCERKSESESAKQNREKVENQIDILEKGVIRETSDVPSDSFEESSSSFSSAKGNFTPFVRIGREIDASSTEFSEFRVTKQTGVVSESRVSKESCETSAPSEITDISRQVENKGVSNTIFGLFSNFLGRPIGPVVSTNNVIIGNELEKPSRSEVILSVKNNSVTPGQVRKTPTININNSICRSTKRGGVYSIHRRQTISKPNTKSKSIKIISDKVVTNLFGNMEPIQSLNNSNNLTAFGNGSWGRDNGSGDRNGGGRDNDGDNNIPHRPKSAIQKIVGSLPSANAREGIGSLRDVLKLIPDFDGKKSSFGKYITGIEDALAMVGEDLGDHILKVAKSRLIGEVWNRVRRNDFENIREYIDYLKRTYDPPRDIFQLQGELGSTAQLDDENVDQYAYKIQEIVAKIKEAQHYAVGYLKDSDVDAIESMAIKCFKRGLKPEILDKMGNEEESFREVIIMAQAVETDLAERQVLRTIAKSKACPNKEIEKGSKKVSMKFVEPINGEIKTVAAFDGGKVGPVTCQVCNNVGHTALTCKFRLEVSEKGVIKCQTCGIEGHTTIQCSALKEKNPSTGAKKCQFCNGNGHIAAECPKIINKGNNMGTIDICQFCNKRGHTAANCYSIPCSNCGKKFHNASNCIFRLYDK